MGDSIPKELEDKMLASIDRVGQSVNSRLSNSASRNQMWIAFAGIFITILGLVGGISYKYSGLESDVRNHLNPPAFELLHKTEDDRKAINHIDDLDAKIAPLKSADTYELWMETTNSRLDNIEADTKELNAKVDDLHKPDKK